jgi:hypothetical protein
MSARILFSAFTVFFFTFSLQIFSQDELGIPKIKNNDRYWSIGYYASGDLSFIDGFINNGNVQYGYGGMIELTYNDSKRDNLMIFGKQKYVSKKDFEYIETYEYSIGPRFELNKNLFCEISIGGVLVNKNLEYYDSYFNEFYYYHNEQSDFGFSLGAGVGKKIKLSKTINFIAKIRLLSAYSFSKEFYLFMNANCGITFNTVKTAKERSQQPSYMGIALIGGLNKPDNTINQSKWSGSYGIEISYRTSPKIELLLSGTYNPISRIDRYLPYQNHISSITGSGRFFFNQSTLTAFVEFGGGYYAHTNNYSQTGDYFNPTREYAGLSVGTGIRLRVTKFFSILTKSNFNFLFKEEPSPAPNYLTLQGGLRFNL